MIRLNVVVSAFLQDIVTQNGRPGREESRSIKPFKPLTTSLSSLALISIVAEVGGNPATKSRQLNKEETLSTMAMLLRVVRMQTRCAVKIMRTFVVSKVAASL